MLRKAKQVILLMFPKSWHEVARSRQNWEVSLLAQWFSRVGPYSWLIIWRWAWALCQYMLDSDWGQTNLAEQEGGKNLMKQTVWRPESKEMSQATSVKRFTFLVPAAGCHWLTWKDKILKQPVFKFGWSKVHVKSWLLITSYLTWSKSWPHCAKLLKKKFIPKESLGSCFLPRKWLGRMHLPVPLVIMSVNFWW